MNQSGQTTLIEQVLNKDRCAVCGACIGYCPDLYHHEGRILAGNSSVQDDGLGERYCPMAGARGSFEGELGKTRQVLIARTRKSDIRDKAQYGGVVSSLISLALSQKIIREAILTSGHPERPPHGVRVKTRAEVLSSAKTRFAASGAVAALNEALLEKKHHPLALVGTPCQIKAAAAMRRDESADLPFIPGRISLLIGLFCRWALDYRQISSYVRYMLMGERAFGYDIPPPPSNIFQIRTGFGLMAFPLDEIRAMRLNACRFCDDLTATMADISVGAVEGLTGWNTVIIRTKAGEELFNLAVTKRYLETGQLPDADLEHLKEAAALKKSRGLACWEQENTGDALY